MPRTTRTFIALPLPGPLKAKLERFQQVLAPTLPTARWTEPVHFHLTLAFLGEIDDSNLHGLCRAIAEAVRPLPRFDLALRGLGAFPDDNQPRVLWAGLVGDLDALAATRAAVAEAATSLGQRPTDDRFQPHISIARLKVDRDEPVDLARLIHQHRGWMGGSFAVDEVITYQSTLTPEGPDYAPLGRAPLDKGSPRADR